MTRLFRYYPHIRNFQTARQEIDPQGPSLYVDSRFQHVPVAVWITGNLTQIADPREYEEFLIRAGAAANRIWLLGIENGLSGTIVAGILPLQAGKALALDGWCEHPLCAVVLGFEHEPHQKVNPDQMEDS